MHHKATHVSTDYHNPDPDAPLPLVLTDAALLEIDSDDAPLLTLTAEAQSILDKECRHARLKRLCRELINAGDDLLASGDDLMICLDKAQASWDDYTTTTSYEAKRAFQDAAIDLFFMLDTVDRLPVGR